MHASIAPANRSHVKWMQKRIGLTSLVQFYPMQRLRQCPLCLLHLAASLACILIFTFWVRSRWAADTFAWSRPAHIVGVTSARGDIYAFHGIRYMPNHDGDGWVHFSGYPLVRPFDRMRSPEGLVFGDNAWGTRYRVIALPAWKLFTICVLILVRRPLAAWEMLMRSKFRERRVTRLGLCRVCGYDLRATPNRCPECGTVPEKKDPTSI